MSTNSKPIVAPAAFDGLLAPGREKSRREAAQHGFSLVEVVLAIGIVAFAFVGLFALLPVGMGIFRTAMDTSVSAQIVQRVIGDATETEFDQLIADPANQASGNYYTLPLRYFDDQGTEVKVSNPAAPTGPERSGPPGILYTVRVRGSLPGPADPGDPKFEYPTSLPSKGGARFKPRDSTFLTIQIANNPAGKNLEINATTNLIDPAKARTAGLGIQTYSVVIARNGYARTNTKP